jgi:gluconolactonase
MLALKLILMISRMFRIFLALLLALMLVNCGQPPETTMADQAPDARSAPAAPDLPPPAGLVAAGAEWETLFSGYVYSEGPAADANGNVYYAEVTRNHLYVIDVAGDIRLFDENTAMTMGLVTGPAGWIYGCRNRDAQIVRYNAQGKREVLLQGKASPLPGKPNAPGEFCNDLAVDADGGVWFTDRINRRVMYLAQNGNVRAVAEGFRPNGIVLSADGQMIAVTDSVEARLHAFKVGEDGALTELADFFAPILTVQKLGQENIQPGRPGTNGMTVDSDGRFYAASFYGIQVFDREGEYIGVISSPKEFLSNLTFGGPDYQWLYATGRQGFYRLKMQVVGPGAPAN